MDKTGELPKDPYSDIVSEFRKDDMEKTLEITRRMEEVRLKDNPADVGSSKRNVSELDQDTSEAGPSGKKVTNKTSSSYEAGPSEKK